MRVAPHTVSSLPVMRAFPRFSGSLGCVLVLTWLPTCVQVANTFSTSTWKTEDRLFEDVRGLQAAGFSVYVLFFVDDKDFLAPGSVTANSSHFYTVVVSTMRVVCWHCPQTLSPQSYRSASLPSFAAGERHHSRLLRRTSPTPCVRRCVD